MEHDHDDGESSLSTASSLSSGSRRGKRRRPSSPGRRKRSRRERDRAAYDDAAAPAASDYDELRRHFQFVLPDGDGEGFGSTWQERMVRGYHSKLYKEYVLADLSRALATGQVGMRWRTESEVVSGLGHRTCGNLACRVHVSGDSSSEAAERREREEEYHAAARRHIGIGVPEVGEGRDPVGVLLPDQSRGEKLREYLSSCAREHSRRDEEGGRDDGRRRESKKRKKHRKHSSKDRSGDGERREERRLSKVPHGLGLHDYEVDFAYRERGERKRELVKARLCLRCAPLLFASKLSKEGGRGGGNAPAVAAREAREKAARDSVRSAGAGLP